MADGESPVYCGVSVKVTASPTSSGPEGARSLAIDRSLPAVTDVLSVAVLLSEIGSKGVALPTLPMPVMVEPPLAEIWLEGAAFNAYRGDDWMQEPCRSCERKHIDFGGCRCQAMALAGDAAATDPVCIRSPLHASLTAAADEDGEAEPGPFVYRGR